MGAGAYILVAIVLLALALAVVVFVVAARKYLSNSHSETDPEGGDSLKSSALGSDRRRASPRRRRTDHPGHQDQNGGSENTVERRSGLDRRRSA